MVFAFDLCFFFIFCINDEVYGEIIFGNHFKILRLHCTLLWDQPIRAKFGLNLNDIYVTGKVLSFWHFLVYNLITFHRPKMSSFKLIVRCSFE